MSDLGEDTVRMAVKCLRTGDHIGLLRLLRGCLASDPPDAADICGLYLNILFPVLTEIDGEFRVGRLTAHEFQLAAIAASRTELVLYARLPAPAVRRGQAVVTCLPGRTQGIRNYLAADLLELEGWDVPVLSPIIDRDQIPDLLSRIHPFLLVLTVDPEDDPEQAMCFVRHLAGLRPLPTLHVTAFGTGPAADALESDPDAVCTVFRDPAALLRMAAGKWESEGRPYALGLSFPSIDSLGPAAAAAFDTADGSLPDSPSFARGPGEVLGSLADLALDAVISGRQAIRRNRELEAANARLLDMTETDYLTGIRNRRFAYGQLDSYMSYKRRNPHFMFCVILFDLDGFKRINDFFGHAAGDTVLIAVARRIRGILRKEDMFARLGGDEFLVSLFNHTTEEALAVAEKLRRAVESLEFPGIGRLTGSFGVTQVADGDDTHRLAERVDRAMYAAKSAGRNRTVVL